MTSLERWVRRNPPRDALRAVDASIVVVIPACRELDYLPAVLDSLELSDHPDVHCVVVVNNERDAETQTLANNLATLEVVRRYPRTTALDYASDGLAFEAKRGGVGAARRVGMDWAIAHTMNPGVTLASLDADSPVDGDYLSAIRSFHDQGAAAGLVGFAHDIPDDERGPAIIAYESWLRFMALGLASVGSPYGFAALGSIIVCSSDAYVRAAGMSTRKGGEDFYFVQKLVKTSGRLAMLDATVRPSSRVSDRVPFGTGPALRETLDGSKAYEEVAPPAAFAALATLLRDVERLRAGDPCLDHLHPLLRGFLEEPRSKDALDRLRTQHRTPDSFARAFGGWFDGLSSRQFLRRFAEAEGRVSIAEAAEAVLGIARDLPPRGRLEQLRRRARSGDSAVE